MKTNTMRALRPEELRQVRGGKADPKKTAASPAASTGSSIADAIGGAIGTYMYMSAMKRYTLAAAARLLVSEQVSQDNFWNGYKQNPQEAGALAYVKVLYEGVGGKQNTP